VAGYRIRLLKRKVAKEMLKLSYTVEKEGVELTTLDKFMINENQINDLLDSLVEHGYTVHAVRIDELESLVK
jgi:hypothetical protein